MNRTNHAGQSGKHGSRTKISWYVVRFPETNEYSVIPTNWIIKNNSEELFCKWPPFKVNSDYLKKGEDPSPSWDTFRVKIVGVNKIYDNFNKAWYKKVKEKYSSTDYSDEENIKKSNKRPLMSSEEETDDDADSNFKIMPPNRAKQVANVPSVLEQVNFGASTSAVIQEFYAEISDKDMHSTEMMPIIVKKCPQNNQFEESNYSNCSFPHTSNEYDSSIHINAYDRSLSNVEGKLNNILEQHPDYDSSIHINAYDRSLSNVEGKLNNILQEQIGIKLLLNRILSKLENNSVNNNQKLIKLDDIFLNKFPINDADSFMTIENRILNELGFESKLEYYVKIIGGNTPKNHVHRVMSKLFTDKYGIQCTWTGRGKNIVTKIGNSKLIMTIKKSVQESCKNNNGINDSEFEKLVSEWLRHANTRYIRSKNHNNNPI